MPNSMRVMGQKGDTKTMWDPNNPAEVEAARDQFNKLVRDKQFLAFRVTGPGEKGEQIREFDPQAGSIIIAPPMAGGSA